jgi:orotate phosphoribosyltransferase
MLAVWTQQFLELAVEYDALRFGQFTLKSGRISPYFFNAGAFCDGRSLHQLAHSYAQAIAAHKLEFDVLFGPAYKGIPLAALVADHLHHSHGINVGFAYNRKEAKDHGEGGLAVGFPLRGRVLLIDDVITAGTAMNESLALIRAAGAEPVAVAVALDRQERGSDDRSAVQALENEGLEVICLACLDHLVDWLEQKDPDSHTLRNMIEYRQRHGV